MKKAILSLCLLVFMACPAQAQQDKVLDIQEVVSSKGIKAWLVEDRSLPIISLKFTFLGAGAKLDPEDKQGLARLVSNTMDEGAGDYDSQSFQKTLNDNSISISFGAGRDQYYGGLKTLSKHKFLAFELLTLALNEPRFDEEPLERMRNANLTRIRSSLSDPEWKAARLLNDTAFAGHPYALNSGGTLSSLKNITSDDLRHFVNTRLGKDNLRIGVTGDIGAEELKEVLDRIFGNLPEKAQMASVADITVQNGGTITLYEHDIPQTIIEIMQPGIGRLDPDYYTGIVMNFILGGSGFGSRLTEEIREKRGLTYGIHSGFYELDHLKGFSISTSTKNESVGEMLALIKAELEKIKTEPVTASELENAKSYLIGSFPLSLSSTDSISAILLSVQGDDLPIDYLDKRTQRIESVGTAQIQALANKLLTPDALTIVMVGKPEGVTPTKTVDTLPNVE